MSSIDEMKEKILTYTKKKKQTVDVSDISYETITLYHGTTSKYLNDILRNGLTPRKYTNINNFTVAPSNEELVYLTTKWHYWYAYHANQQSLIQTVGEQRFEEEDIELLWNETSDFPIYLECEVPIEYLTLDEDVVYQWDIKKAIKTGEIQEPSHISVQKCLDQGTVASIATILPEHINSIMVLGNPNYREYLLDGQYGVEASQWFKGFGVGELSADDLLLLEVSKFNQGNELIEVTYPSEDMLPIHSISLDVNGNLIVKHKE